MSSIGNGNAEGSFATLRFWILETLKRVVHASEETQHELSELNAELSSIKARQEEHVRSSQGVSSQLDTLSKTCISMEAHQRTLFKWKDRVERSEGVKIQGGWQIKVALISAVTSIIAAGIALLATLSQKGPG